jgi:hypothetical protein
MRPIDDILGKPPDAHQNGSTSPLSPDVLRMLLQDGPQWIVAYAEDAVRLESYGFPVICLSGGDALSAETLAPLTKLAVLQYPGEEGAAFGLQVKQQLQALSWAGTLTRCPLPDPFYDLAVVEREAGAEGFRPLYPELAGWGAR